MIDWKLAERIAVRIGSRASFSGAHSLDGLAHSFDCHTRRAEGLVAEATGLRSLTGLARAKVVDRSVWIRSNLLSLRRILSPLFERTMPERSSKAFPLLGHRASAVEMGVMLGWMSTRVLGQYDVLILEDEDVEDQDVVYYVGPNVVALERHYAFEPQDFRLWLALHEVTHRAQFTGVPWMREYYLGLIRTLLEEAGREPTRLIERMEKALAFRRDRAGIHQSTGLLSLLVSPPQRVALDRITGLMSLLEGHGETTMDRAGEGFVRESGRFRRVMSERRQAATGVARILQRLMGFEAKLAQYAQGEGFIRTVESVGGSELLDKVWEDPRNLPDLSEIREPSLWLRRVSSLAGESS